MADLAFCSIAEQLGVTADDRFTLAEPPGQFLVSAARDLAANTVADLDDGYACWLAPGRRLVVAGTAPEGFVSDMTHGLAVFALRPPDDLAFLAMGCTLAPEALADGRCAQTLFAGVRVLLARRDGTLRLHVERPLAAYLRDWFRQAATSL
jgi:sarcosine oxidase gamma subunit